LDCLYMGLVLEKFCLVIMLFLLNRLIILRIMAL